MVDASVAVRREVIPVVIFCLYLLIAGPRKMWIILFDTKLLFTWQGIKSWNGLFTILDKQISSEYPFYLGTELLLR